MTNYKEERARRKELRRTSSPMNWLLATLNATKILTGQQHCSGKKAERARLCKLYGVENSGRQWTRLRKTLAYHARRATQTGE